MLKTILTHIWILLSTAVFSYLAIIASVWDGSGNKSHNTSVLWARLILLVSGVKLHVTGMENIKGKKSFILMPNHQSNFDIPVLYAGVKTQFRWVAKAELFKIPFFGYAMKRAGCVSIDRTNRDKAIQSLRNAGELIKKGSSVIIFPEGTRSETGAIMSFKKGGIMLSITTGISIVPVVITGTNRIMQKGGFKISAGDVYVDILPPVETKSYTGKNKRKLIADIRNQMIIIQDKRIRELESC